jgi:signal transduction histidine kinase/AraC-like DNA-binding protein/ABC-type sugar transport system substrate-binding protein
VLVSHTVRIGSRVGSADPFWVQVREAVHQRAQQLPIELLSIDIDQAALAGEEPIGLVEELLAHDLDALICTYLGERLAYRLLDCGLPIVHLTETDIRHRLFVSPLGFYDIAQMVGAYLAERLNGRGQILAVGGLMAERGEDGRSRLAGIRDALRAYPQITLRHIPSTWRYERAYPQIEAALRQLDGPIDAIFGLSDSLALAARDAGRALGRIDSHTLIVGINGDPLALAAIADGSMAATVETSAADFGNQAVDLAYQAALGQPLPAHFSYKPRLVTAQNVAEVAMQKLIAIADLPNRLVGVNRQQEQRRLTQLETSLEINRRAGSLLNRKQLSHELADLIRTSYGYDQVQLFLWSAREQVLILEQPERWQGAAVRIPLAEAGLLGQALVRNEPIFIPDTRRSHRFPPDPHWPDTRSRVVVPIRLGGTTLGLLDLHSRQSTQHTHQELVGLQSLADQLGIAMRNAELYDEALQARAAAEKADRLKTRLLANVSHELRTPLNVIVGYSQAALAVPNPYGCELPEALVQDLQHIYHSGEHLIRLINDLLDLSRAEIDELDLFPEAIDTRPFLTDVFHSMASSGAAQDGVTWRLELPDRLPLIQADPVRLRQILFNLLSNARKFTAQGEIVLGAEVAPPHLHLWVRDTGVGIPIDQQERIFEPFVTGDQAVRRQEGVGLGLSITRRLVALHGGSMTLESQPGQGSTFHVYLPLPTLHGQPASAPPTACPALLLISACEQPAAAIAELSRRRGLAICRLQAGDDPLALLARVQPAALAWDLAHSHPGDWGLIEKIRSHPQFCRLPLILYGQDPGAAPELALGVTNILTKPLSGKTLVEMIDAVRRAEPSGLILIVDDDPQARALYRDLVVAEFPGYAVRTAEDGAAALAILEHDTPSLVILDLMMPQIDGFAVLEYMRAHERTRPVPVLVMSGRMLAYEEIERLNHALVAFQSKEILTRAETVASVRRVLMGTDLLPQHTSALVKRAVAYIQQHHARDLSRQDIAAAVGVSKNYLSQIFHQELGISPWEYLNRYRIKQAKELLRRTDARITEVAAQVGFADLAYFSRVFRKHVGASPRTYRERPSATHG